MKSIITALILILLGFTSPMGAQADQSNSPSVLPPGLSDETANPTTASLNAESAVLGEHVGASTNGVACELSLNYTPPYAEKWHAPTCVPLAVSVTTNSNSHFLNIPLEGCCQLKLVDSTGHEVPESAAGKKFVFWSEAQITNWVSQNTFKIKYDDSIFFSLHGGGQHQFFPGFSVPESFVVDQPGDYILHVRLRLLRPPIRSATGIFTFDFIWLPEVVATVRIGPEAVAKRGSSASNGTNAPPK